MAQTLPASDMAVRQAAATLRTAAADRVPCAPVRELIGRTDAAAAYGVQELITAARVAAGATVVGRKIGLTSTAVQAQLGVLQPDFGVLFDDMAYGDGDLVPVTRLLQPRVEAEIGFVLAEDLTDGPLDLPRMRDAVDYAVAAIEIVDSRIANWDITFADTVADNASSGLYALGTQRRTMAELTPVDVEMQLSVDGDVVSTGTGAACLGDPLEALAWLARTARTFGNPLRAGQLVLSGALGPMHPVHPGAAVTAEITGLGTVSITFSEEEA